MSGLSADFTIDRERFSLQAVFEADDGVTLGLLGPNGAGKSTIVDAVSGILPIVGGHIRAGEEIWDEPASRTFVSPQRRSVGVMFQHLALFPALSVIDNVAYGAKARHREAPRDSAARVLEKLGAAHLTSRAPSSLSGGEAQKVALARALVVEPRVLLLDEPLSALDIRSRGSARGQLKEVLSAFPGVRVLVTHDAIEAMTLADRVVIIEDGRVTQQGDPAEIRRHPRSEYAAAFAGTNLLSGALRIRGEHTTLQTAQGDLTVVAEAMGDGDRVLASVHPSTVTLSLEHGSTSARNQILSRVAEIDDVGSRVRVVLEGSPPLVAEVTHEAIDSLGLRPGVEVWAAVKATRIEVYPDA